MTTASAPTTATRDSLPKRLYRRWLLTNRIDIDTLWCGLACFVATAGVVGVLCGSRGGRALSGVGTAGPTAALGTIAPAFIATVLIWVVLVVRRGRVSRHRRIPWRRGLAELVSYLITVALLLHVLSGWLHNATLAVTATWLGSTFVGAGWLAEHWWRRPLNKLPKPKPGEVWWADIQFEESRDSKDRPCLVLSGSGRRRRVLMITSQDKSDRAGYLAVPDTMWRKPQEKTSWLKTDRMIVERVEKFRRLEAAGDAGFTARARRAAGA